LPRFFSNLYYHHEFAGNVNLLNANTKDFLKIGFFKVEYICPVLVSFKKIKRPAGAFCVNTERSVEHVDKHKGFFLACSKTCSGNRNGGMTQKQTTRAEKTETEYERPDRGA
jgi:hypothetical protein